MAGPLDEGVAEGRGRVHDGRDGVCHPVDDVVDLVEVDAAEVLLHKGLDRLGLTVGVEQRPRLHHSNSYYELHTARNWFIMTLSWADFSHHSIKCILSELHSLTPPQKRYSDQAQVRWDLTLRSDGVGA